MQVSPVTLAAEPFFAHVLYHDKCGVPFLKLLLERLLERRELHRLSQNDLLVQDGTSVVETENCARARLFEGLKTEEDRFPF